MIIFHGDDLEELVPIKIDDIRVSPVALTPVTRQRPITPGMEFVRMQEVERTVTVTFALLDMDRDARFQALQKITEWAHIGQIESLALPMMPGFHLDVGVTALPEPSYRMWWESKLRLTFKTFDDPFWISDNEQAVNCKTDMTIGGTAPPLMRIERTLTAPAANQSYSDGVGDLMFSQIPAGSLEIDLNRQIATVSGTAIGQYITPTSTYIIPRTGTYRINGIGRVVYRERWV